MPQITYSKAARRTIVEEMRADCRVFVMGEDVQEYLYAEWLDELGRERLRDTPICEAGFFGAAIGAALTGMRPVVEGAFSTFLYSAMDQIVNQAAKSRYMFGGQASVPMVIRVSASYTGALAAHHSDRPWGLFAQVPGLKIIVPTTAYDVVGLLRSAIRDGNPVLCFDDATCAGLSGEVPDEYYTIPLGTAEIKRVGTDLTLVAVGGAVHQGLAAARVLEQADIDVEVIDVRSVVPLDRHTILRSARKTGRLMVVDPAPSTCSVASEVAAVVAENAWEYLHARIVRLAAPDVPVPFSPDLERLIYPDAEGIVAAARKLCDGWQQPDEAQAR